MKKPLTVGFGEIMLRLCPEGHYRLGQSIPGRLVSTFAGAEANVCASLAMFGARSKFVSALPSNEITNACLAQLTGLGVDTSDVLREEGRFGVFYVEKGANQRPSRVVYDRSGTSIAETLPEKYVWKNILEGASWLHVSGITPALSGNAAEAAIQVVRWASEYGITVSCDLNFRAKLWNWEKGTSPSELAGKIMHEILKHTHVVIANEEDAESVLGIKAQDSDVNAGVLEHSYYPDVAAQIVTRYPKVEIVAITLRESVSATCNNWGAMLFEAKSRKAHFAPTNADGSYDPYRIASIVDRVGGGDSFAGALIYALQDPKLQAASDAVQFAVASSCLAHSVEGDFNFSSRAEVESLMRGSASGRVVR